MPRPSEFIQTLEVDPSTMLNKLPQPYRRIDKIIAEIVSMSIEQGEAKLKARKESEKQKAQTTEIVPAAMYEDLGEVTTVAASATGVHMFVGNNEGQLLVVHLPSASVIVRSNVHPGPVEALAVAAVTCKQGSCLLASASKKLVCVYLVGFDRSLLMLLCSGEPPSTDPSTTVTSLALSSDGLSLFCGCSDGAFAMYKVPPVEDVENIGDGTGITRTLSMSASQSAEAAGSSPGAATGVMMQIEQPAVVPPTPTLPSEGKQTARAALTNRSFSERKGPGQRASRIRQKSIRQSHPLIEEPNAVLKTPRSTIAEGEGEKKEGEEDKGPARLITPPVTSVFVHWANSNHLLHFEIPATGSGPILTTGGMGTGENQAEDANGNPAVIETATHDWALPHPVTTTCYMTDMKLLMVGLADGTTVVYDTHLIQMVTTLPRIAGAVTSIEYIDTAETKAAIVASSKGEICKHCLNTLVNNPASARPQPLRRPVGGPGAVYNISWKGDGLLMTVLKDDVMKLYDINSANTVGQFHPLDQHAFVEELQKTSLWFVTTGLLITGCRRVPTEEELAAEAAAAAEKAAEAEASGESVPPQAADGEEAEEVDPTVHVPTCTKLLVYDVRKAHKKLRPLLDTLSLSNPSPMIQRMLADAEMHNAPPPVPSSNSIAAAPGSPRGAMSRGGKTPRDDSLTPHHKSLRIKSLASSNPGIRYGAQVGVVPKILDGIITLGGGQKARQKRMAARMSEIAADLRDEDFSLRQSQNLARRVSKT